MGDDGKRKKASSLSPSYRALPAFFFSLLSPPYDTKRPLWRRECALCFFARVFLQIVVVFQRISSHIEKIVFCDNAASNVEGRRRRKRQKINVKSNRSYKKKERA